MGDTWCKNVHVLHPAFAPLLLLAKRSQIVIGECTLLSMLSTLHHHSPLCCDMSKQLFSDGSYVMLGICRKRAYMLLAYNICWFGVPRIPNYSHSEKNFSWSLPDNLFYIVSCDLSFWHLSYSFRACLMSLRICIVCLELFVLNCLFGNLTIQKHYFMTPRWGVAVCICLVCICLNIPCSAWN